jgi:hypothetical protein
MQEQDDWAAKLIRLKRYETPGPEYFERFIEEFHQRQRVEPLRVSVMTLGWDRLSTWWRSVSLPARWAAASAFLAAAGTLAWGVFPNGPIPEPQPQSGPALAEVSLIREF